MKSVEWIILITEHYEAMRRFYTETLSLPVIRNIPEEEFTQYSLNNCYLAVYGKDFAQKITGAPFMGKPGAAIYSLKESSNVDADYEHLLGLGVPFISAPVTHPHGQRTAFFYDPDGNIWEIQQWIKK